MSASRPDRGDIWDLNFNPTQGREQAGHRPALIVSVNPFNHGPAELLVAIPLTRSDKKIRWHVAVKPPEGGLSDVSYIKCEDVRSLSKSRLTRYRGRVSSKTMAEVEDRLRILLGL
ncbi:MAG: type II toxin-antitoxin system PemK/MazF family toxin [Bryobacterales bacterium]